MSLSDPDPLSQSKILRKLPQDLRQIFARLYRLQQVCIAVTAEIRLEPLLEYILRSARELCAADAGSIFVRVDEIQERPNATPKDQPRTVSSHLAMKIVQNDSIDFPFREAKLPLDCSTIAGYVATTGQPLLIADVAQIPKDAPYRHFSRYDEATGYRTRSMMVVPMVDRRGERIGVLQLINKKEHRGIRLPTETEVRQFVRPFDEIDEELVLALASQAAVAIEKAALYRQIEEMFRSFVDSLTRVLEKRNYTTFGHCRRMANYARALAKEVSLRGTGRLAGVQYTPQQIEELEYAALLHDIGKLSVPDAVLDKRNKLTDDQMKIIEYRFAYAAQARPDPEYRKFLAESLEFLRRINIPRPMTDADVERLRRIRNVEGVDIDGRSRPLLTDMEFENLSIRSGNLTKEERKKIEEHITETWDILRRINWPPHLAKIPALAASHHEKMDGSGYPWGLQGDEIPLGGRILAIVDIFEALTAQDRPYKPPIPVEQALGILQDLVNQGKLDKDLFEIFVRQKVYALHIADLRPKTS